MTVTRISRALLALFIGLPTVQAGSSALKGTAAARDEPAEEEKKDLHPPLRPLPFDKDYPHDMQPRASKHMKFDHPYPDVQESDDYDQDYPKDENSDSGEWHAQMEYDEARAILTKKEDAERRAKRAKEAMDRELGHAKKELDHADAEARRAEKASKRAADGYFTDVDDEDEEDTDTVDTKSVDEAIAEVEERTKNLPDCEEQLAQAQAKLKELLKDKDEHVVDRVEEILEAKNDVWRANKAQRKAEEHQRKIETRRTQLEESLAQMDEKLAALNKDLEDKSALERAAVQEMEEAKNRLRKFRKVPEEIEPLHHIGKQDHEEHSGTARPSGLLTLFAAVLLAPLASLFVVP